MTYPNSKHSDPLRLGDLYQDLIGRLLQKLYGVNVHFYGTQEDQYSIGESVEGIEVKFDNWCTKTRRLSIEVGEKTRANLARFSPSGIMRKDNTVWYAQGNMVRCWVFLKGDLQSFFKTRRPAIVANDPKTIQKFYLHLLEADKIAKYSFSVSPYVCDYDIPPVPNWENCLPCPLYKDEHCLSQGAAIYRAIMELEKPQAAKEAT